MVVPAAHTEEKFNNSEMEVKWSVGLNRASQEMPCCSSRYIRLFNEAKDIKTK